MRLLQNNLDEIIQYNPGFYPFHCGKKNSSARITELLEGQLIYLYLAKGCSSSLAWIPIRELTAIRRALQTFYTWTARGINMKRWISVVGYTACANPTAPTVGRIVINVTTTIGSFQLLSVLLCFIFAAPFAIYLFPAYRQSTMHFNLAYLITVLFAISVYTAPVTVPSSCVDLDIRDESSFGCGHGHLTIQIKRPKPLRYFGGLSAGGKNIVELDFN
ncbi:hypothetical protein DFJ43DRAFT_1042092 [Lentinula guzmanii]|uniref:Uncharacterized protein n=1 Tax=Lentinula guzmanii TaxID=2804957 RepID=A0AA38MWM9_9AGAR|nr:hypothetical protein DFJ43DRAFT_1042092 [Lentinula guzmanii]